VDECQPLPAVHPVVDSNSSAIGGSVTMAEPALAVHPLCSGAS
jgi:hypothetical protein